MTNHGVNSMSHKTHIQNMGRQVWSTSRYQILLGDQQHVVEWIWRRLDRFSTPHFCTESLRRVL